MIAAPRIVAARSLMGNPLEKKAVWCLSREGKKRENSHVPRKTCPSCRKRTLLVTRGRRVNVTQVHEDACCSDSPKCGAAYWRHLRR